MLHQSRQKRVSPTCQSWAWNQRLIWQTFDHFLTNSIQQGFNKKINIFAFGCIFLAFYLHIFTSLICKQFVITIKFSKKNSSPAWDSLTRFELVVSMSLVPGKKLFLSAYCVLYCFFAFSIEVRYSFCLCSHTKKMYVLNFHEILSEQLPVLSVSYTYALWPEFLNFVQKF